MTYKDIKNKSAYEVLDALNMHEPPFDPFEIAQALGLSVSTELNFNRLDNEGLIEVGANNEPLIWINPLKSQVRQRFTLAHELGHLANDVLPDIDNPIIDKYETLYRNGTGGRKERNANDFAAKLLMPLKQIEAFLLDIKAKQNGNLSAEQAVLAVAARFEVSKQSAFFRLKNLGIISREVSYPF